MPRFTKNALVSAFFVAACQTTSAGVAPGAGASAAVTGAATGPVTTSKALVGICGVKGASWYVRLLMTVPWRSAVTKTTLSIACGQTLIPFTFFASSTRAIDATSTPANGRPQLPCLTCGRCASRVKVGPAFALPGSLLEIFHAAVTVSVFRSAKRFHPD